MVKLHIKDMMAAVKRSDGTGFCVVCGHMQGGCEPDARKYLCESCKRHTVYGAEEILMGFVC